MWTNNGCRGIFMCNDVNTTCNVDGDGQHTCVCGKAGPVTCKGNITDLQKEILFNDDVIAGGSGGVFGAVGRVVCGVGGWVV
jgi:hypothetical protein